MFRKTAIALALALTAVSLQAADKNEQNENAKTASQQIKPDPSLIEYQKRLAKIEREMELMRQQNALLQAKISRIQAQRQYEQVVSGGLPGVLTVFKSGGQLKARVRYQTGIERVVGVGDPLNKRTVVAAIDEKTGVIARVGRKKIVLDYISRNSASMPGALPSPTGGAPLPPPVVR